LSVSCECCVLSGRGLCDELIPRPEQSYRLWRVYQCDREASTKRGGPGPYIGLSSHTKKNQSCNIQFIRTLIADKIEVDTWTIIHCLAYWADCLRYRAFQFYDMLNLLLI
jgi:hypothetical protein